LFVFYFNGGYIIRIRPIAKGILVVPLENVDEIAAGRKEVPMATPMPWQGISRGLNNYRENLIFSNCRSAISYILFFLRIHRKAP
jgi:hypothetical protein